MIFRVRLPELVANTIQRLGENYSTFIRDAVIEKLLKIDQDFVENRKKELQIEKEKLEIQIRRYELELQELEERKKEILILLKQAKNELNKLNEEIEKINVGEVLDYVKVLKQRNEMIRSEIMKFFDDFDILIAQSQNGELIKKVTTRLESISKMYNVPVKDLTKIFVELYGEKSPRIKALFIVR
ncbi:MAG: hypothetical protein QXV35_01070 [Archaeoglobaceae archaeon]